MISILFPEQMDVLNSLVNYLDEALIILDNEGNILLFNEVAVRLGETILTKPIKEGDNMSDLTSLKTSLWIKEIIGEIQIKKMPEKHFMETTNHNGAMVSLEFNFVPVINEEGVETHINLFVRDNTPQKIFERKMVTQTTNITNLIEKANAIIIGIDTRGYVTDWNEHCMKVTGFAKNEVYAQKFVNVLMKNLDHGRFEEILQNGLDQEPAINHELSIRAQNGGIITLLLNSNPRLSTSGKVIGLTLVGQDITELIGYRSALEFKVEERTRELKRALQKETEVVEMKGRFVSIVSHEFRFPLSIIQSQTQFIKKNLKQIRPEDLLERVTAIGEHAERMSHLLDEDLTFGTSETLKIQVDASNIVLIDFLNRITEEVCQHNKREPLCIKTDFIDLPKVITIDESLLRSILINLLSNAIKFSPGKDQVYLTIKRVRNLLMITVRDEGIGISVNEIDEVFNPFIAGKTPVSIHSAGLGLSLVKKSVELLNGTITTTSEVKKGTTIIVTIPCIQDV